MNPLPVWRIAAGIAVLLILLTLALVLLPIYFHNWQLQDFVAGLTRSASSQTASDSDLRSRVLAKSRALNLPVAADDVQISRTNHGVRIDVHYLVTVNLPGYSVGLHFGPAPDRR